MVGTLLSQIFDLNKFIDLEKVWNEICQTFGKEKNIRLIGFFYLETDFFL